MTQTNAISIGVTWVSKAKQALLLALRVLLYCRKRADVPRRLDQSLVQADGERKTTVFIPYFC